MIATTPTMIAQFRETTAKSKPISGFRTCVCNGCNVTRSMAQYIAGSPYCSNCRRKGVTTDKPKWSGK